MQIYSIQSFAGKNIYSHRPVIKMVLNIGELFNKPTNQIDGFNENLLRAFPGLNQHSCSTGHVGGFVERLNEGTYISHVIEHLALEIQRVMGYDMKYGKTRVVTEPSLYYVVIEYHNERCALECCKAAVEVCSCLSEGKVPDTEAMLENIRKIKTECEMGPSTEAIFNEAKSRKIPVTRMGEGSILRLGYGKNTRYIEAALTDKTTSIICDIASDKNLTKRILSDYNLPVPAGDLAYTLESAVKLADDIGYPVVVKPSDANQGKGVTLAITNEDELTKAYNEALKHSKSVIIEKFIEGADYRILVVGDKVSAASERRPPSVTGDGVHTIEQLVQIENENPLRGDNHSMPLSKINLDSITLSLLSRYGMSKDHIPKQGEVIKLKENGNLSVGGTARACTAELHPDNVKIAVKAAQLLNLDIAGIDIVARDISAPIDGKNGAIIEINAVPGLRMHLFPSEGEATNVAADIMDMVYPDKDDGRIPIVSITGTNGKTTVTRLISHIFTLNGYNVGMTSTSGVYVGGKCVLKGDNTGPASAEMVLTDKTVEAAVLETARGGIIRRGLGYDLADVGIVTNISEDHIGIDGADSVDDLAFAKSLVCEAIRPGGFAVLNAADDMTDYIADRTDAEKILFSVSDMNLKMRKHISNGGRAVFVRDGTVYVHDENGFTELVDTNDIPITFGGIVTCNIENSLAAVAATSAMGIAPEIIAQGLRTFKPDMESNPGRFNMFDLGTFKIMLDYGHNTAGYKAVADFITKIRVNKLIGVIGMPGDRADKYIVECGKLCADIFDVIIIKEDIDLRGRKPGAVAEILKNTVSDGRDYFAPPRIITSEIEALRTAMDEATEGDLIVMFYEDLEPLVELVENYTAKQQDAVEIKEAVPTGKIS